VFKDLYRVALERLNATGTRSASTFLRGDGTWAAASGGVSDGDKGDITVSGSGATWTIDNNAVATAKIADGAVTYAKIQDVSATQRLLGRNTAGSGDAEEVTVAQLAAWSGMDGFTALVVASDQDITNAAVQNITGLDFAVTAGEFYLLEFCLIYSGSDSGADSAFDLKVDAGTMKGQGTCQGFAAGLTAANTILVANAAANISQTALGNRADSAHVFSAQGSFAFTPTNTTTFRLRWGNNVATPSAISRLKKGSVIRYKQTS
jgi:hypothetical protein